MCHFRHLIEANGLGKTLFDAVNAHLAAKGIKVGTGSIMDATIIAAPSSTKNEDGQRDPEMQQTKKGNQWYPRLRGDQLWPEGAYRRGQQSEDCPLGGGDPGQCA